jgi:hyperosmotically inducible periplasmic protein
MKNPVLILIPLIVLSLAITAGAMDPLVITAGAQATGTAVDDGTITSEISSKIRKDQLLKGFQIFVETRNKTVTLTGSVDSSDARDRAAKLANSAKGVKRVYNLIKVSN